MGFRVKAVANFLIKVLNNCIGKDDSLVVFASRPDFGGNAHALWDYLNVDTKLKTLWIVENQETMDQLANENIKAYYKKSLGAYRSIFKAKYLVTTHNHFLHIKSKNQVVINLWHGMPLKAMGFLDSTLSRQHLDKSSKLLNKSDYFVVTSKIMKYAISSCFLMNPRKIKVLGQARNDSLFSKPGKELLERVLGENLSKYKKIILYTPTFRSGHTDRVEGNVIKDNIFRLEDYKEEEFQKLLLDKEILFICKLHPFEEKIYMKEDITLPPNCKLLTSKDLINRAVSLYDILNAFDVLITDYSSIYFDYMLLDRPMIFLNNDFEQYNHVRGIIFDDYDFWTPGEKASCFPEFIQAMETSIESDPLKDQRHRINALVNYYQDGDSSKRIYEQIMKK